jgi:hypothetical protein
MKMFKSVFGSLLFASLALAVSSCKNGNGFGNDTEETQPIVAQSVSAMTATNTSSSTSGVTIPQSFCSEKTVNLCSSTGTIGTVSVKRGVDNRFYITYKGQSNWYLAQLNLYAGPESGIPNYLANFPLRKTFTYPFTIQEYTFAQANLPASFSVVAYGILVKKINGKIVASKIVWADGCSGLPIDVCDGEGTHKAVKTQCGGGCQTDLDGGTYFNYTSTSCNALSTVPATEPDNLCSMPVNNFFWIDPANPNGAYWRSPSVTVGGYTYTEAEAKAIGNCADGNGGVVKESKYSFMRVATLKLSGTEYTLSPSLNPAVATIENWLATVGKLSTTNLPSGNAAIKTAQETINTWIDSHGCAIEE